jgi:hypothetical protein
MKFTGIRKALQGGRERSCAAPNRTNLHITGQSPETTSDSIRLQQRNPGSLSRDGSRRGWKIMA